MHFEHSPQMIKFYYQFLATDTKDLERKSAISNFITFYEFYERYNISFLEPHLFTQLVISFYRTLV